jgi:hypothetical protein
VILRYRSRPRAEDEILCHNHNLNRYFVAVRGGWKLCPCCWRPELGPHYARPDFVEWVKASPTTGSYEGEEISAMRHHLRALA